MRNVSKEQNSCLITLAQTLDSLPELFDEGLCAVLKATECFPVRVRSSWFVHLFLSSSLYCRSDNCPLLLYSSILPP